MLPHSESPHDAAHAKNYARLRHQDDGTIRRQPRASLCCLLELRRPSLNWTGEWDNATSGQRRASTSYPVTIG